MIDNASYHSRITDDSKRPTTGWRKGQIQEWLRAKGVAYEAGDIKKKLLEKASGFFTEKKFCLEEMTKQFCEANGTKIKVLRLAVGHSDLNPIELIWARVKNWVAAKNVKFNITTVKVLI